MMAAPMTAKSNPAAGTAVAAIGQAAWQKAQIQPEAKNRKYSRNNVNKANVNKVNVQVNVNKVNVRVNVNKVNDKVTDMYSIHSHYKGNHRRGAAAASLTLSLTLLTLTLTWTLLTLTWTLTLLTLTLLTYCLSFC